MSEIANKTKKRLFQVLDDMNVHDIENDTKLVTVSGTFIAANKVKQGAKVIMGTDEACLFQIANNEVIPVLLLLNKEEYLKRMNQ